MGKDLGFAPQWIHLYDCIQPTLPTAGGADQQHPEIGVEQVHDE
jgi:hypothetical protein